MTLAGTVRAQLRTFTQITASSGSGVACTTLKQRLQRDMLAALKAKDSPRATILKQLHSELLKAEKSPQPTDEISTLRRCCHRWKSAIKEYEQLGERSEGATREKLMAARENEAAELAIIEGYLPVGYSLEELKLAIDGAICETSSSTYGNRMGAVMKTVLGKLDNDRVDRKELSSLITHALSQQ